VGVLGAEQASTSAHDVGVAGTAWGGGAAGTDGTTITLECGSCHDPHGNGNYRILRAIPTDGLLTFPGSVAVTSVTKNATLSSGTTYYYDVVTSAAHAFKVTNPVTFYGTTGGADSLIGSTVKVVTDTRTTVSMRSVSFASATGGTVGFANRSPSPGQWRSANATYKTWNVHGLVAGQKDHHHRHPSLTGYNVAAATIVSVQSTGLHGGERDERCVHVRRHDRGHP
jgi:hypothetical protein